MASKIESYLFFDGRAEEAAEFYKTALGAEVQGLIRFKDAPPEAGEGCTPRPENADKVMHMALKIGDTIVMGSDGECKGQTDFKGFSLAYNAADSAEVDRTMQALAAGGKIVMPADRTFFSERFGMVTDKFGITWMVLVYKP
ncbi:VOC family protein [Cupriavidus sp. SZY C1]|uniref:VOC family protein n=1 Tax=Cupriavidus sp. SZY C1 TaxID=3055037 RepID=UPI0028B45FBA|nr:VOC family protein [Cupriavidus sp. SZY C1]MDT6963777.1 VOC family protein [Cupriavidus sp. SZY C1]